MGRLSGFLQGFTGSLAEQMKEDRDAKRKAEEEDQRFKTQLNYAKVARAMQLTQDAASAPPAERADGDPFVAGPGGYQQKFQTLKPAKFNLETGDVEAPATWENSGSRAVPTPIRKAKEVKRTEGDEFVTYRVYEDGGPDEEIARAPRYRPDGSGGSGGGSSAKDRFELRNIGGRVMRVNITTGEKEDMGPSAGESASGAGGMTEKGWREGFDSTLSSIEDAGEGKLKSVIRQYGGDNIMLPEKPKVGDSGDYTDMLRETAFAVAETYWNERKPSNKKADEQDGELTLDQALSLARKKSGGKLSPDVERRIRDAYGAN
jgi:hypothetical protein